MTLTNEQQLAQLTRLQQKELDASLLYRRLSELAKSDAERTALKKIAADEARHAAIASTYTKVKLSPSKNLAFVGGAVARVIGLRRTMTLLAKAENSAADTLAPMCEFCPEVREIIKDETEHGRMLGELAE